MFIVHGQKKIEKRLGWVADFCPICRRPTACQLIRLNVASHLYLVSLGEGKPVATLVECAECHTRTATEALRHTGIEKKRPADLADLMAKTFPAMPEQYASRFAIEAAIRDDPKSLEPAVRRQMLCEPFELLEPALTTRAHSSVVDFQTGLGCFGTMALGLASPFLVHYLVPVPAQDAALIVVLVMLGIGILYTLIQSNLGIGRYVRKFTLANLVRALGPLKPELSELQSILGACKQRKMTIGKRVKADALWAKLNVP